jgi:hypothetical protein
MVSRHPDPPLPRPRALATGRAAAQSRQSARHARRSRLVRRVGALPHPCRRALSPDLHRREALRPHDDRRGIGRLLARFPQLPGHERTRRRRVVGSDLPEQQRVRSLALSSRRRPEVPRQHAVGPPARAEPVRRHRAAGVLPGGAEARRRPAQYLHGHAARPDRSSAPVQARRLVLPDHGGRRHGVGTRRHDGAFARAPGTVRAASRRVHSQRASSPRRRAPARGSRRPGRDAVWTDLHGLSLRTAARQSRPLHARARDGDSADDMERRWVAAHDDPRRHSGGEGARARESDAATTCADAGS